MREMSAEKVQADLVRVHQSGVKEIAAQEVGLHETAVGRVTAATLTAHESAAGVVQAENATFAESGIGAARAETLQLQGNAGVLFSGDASVADSAVGVLAGRSLRAERVNTVVLLAGEVEGEVQTVLDTRGAILAGLVGGVTAGIFLAAAQFLFRRD